MSEQRVIRVEGENLATQLERVRLAHRIARLRTVVAALEERRSLREGATPLPLIQALRGFRDELRAAERRLDTLDGGSLRIVEP